jgi:hypothetical protein
VNLHECVHESGHRVSTLSYSLLVGALFIFLSVSALAQQQPELEYSTSGSDQDVTPPLANAVEESTQSTPSAQSDMQGGKKKFGIPSGILIVPIPISSPAIGSGIIPVLAYIFTISSKDKISSPSYVGVAGLFTNNGSRAFVVGGQLYLKENRYQITSAFTRGNINYNIYGTERIQGKLPLIQTGQAFFGEFLYRVGWKFFAGPRFLTGNSFVTIAPNNESTVPVPPDVGLHTTLTAIGIRVLRNTSPNRFYPISGSYFSFTADFFSEKLGSKYAFQSYKTEFNKYWSVSKEQVLAFNSYFCAIGGQPPFYGNCIYGTDSELRGYTAGRYFDRYAVATQLEYRLVLPKRFGLVAFGGAGGVIPGGSQFLSKQKFLPSGGVGLRFELNKKYHVNLRADVAQGRDGHTFSMGIGEVF